MHEAADAHARADDPPCARGGAFVERPRKRRGRPSVVDEHVRVRTAEFLAGGFRFPS